METTKIAIYGASGHGKAVAEIAECLGYAVAYFIDDDETKNELMGLEVIAFEKCGHLPIALGVGSNSARKKVFNKIEREGYEILTLIHPSATISKRADIGAGSVVMANAVINSDATVGIGAIINTASVVEHDNNIGNFTHISPNAALAGNVTIGDFTHIGIGSCVVQGVQIGTHCIVGAGSVVIDNIADNSKVVGNPAKKYLN